MESPQDRPAPILEYRPPSTDPPSSTTSGTRVIAALAGILLGAFAIFLQLHHRTLPDRRDLACLAAAGGAVVCLLMAATANVNGRLRWTTAIRLFLAGWHPKRNRWDRLTLPVSFAVFPEARRILTRYGGLKLGNRNERTLLDPSSGDEASDRIRKCVARLGRRLYPVGYREHQDREYLLVDESGIVYLLTGDTLRAIASSFERALDHLARGVIRQRSVNDDLRAIGMAKQRWEVDDAPQKADD